MMDIVYSGAAALLAWSSSHQTNSWLTYVDMHRLTKLEVPIDETFHDVGQPTAKQPLWHEWTDSMARGYGPLEAFNDLFRFPYFSRVCTTQEVFLSRNIIICHGSFAVYFRMLLFKAVQGRRWGIMQTQDSGHNQTFNAIHADSFFSLYHSLLCGPPLAVLEALLLAQDRYAKINHDSVYGILGLLDRRGTDTAHRPGSAW